MSESGYFSGLFGEGSEWTFLCEETEYRKKFSPNSTVLAHFNNHQLIDYFIQEFTARDTANRYSLKQEGNRVFFTDGSRSMVTLIVGTNHFQLDFDFGGELAFSAVYEATNRDRSYYWKSNEIITAPGLYAALDIVMRPITADNFRC
ncbi:hypothetical protein HNP10_002200 [Aeromonas veronii]|uniref:hypothetical protein n=1 Tax=Aeromonas veronii TaxID=654 RepID=UPI001606F9C4|nr:hypothetical protein [Aeromonas veronii]MCS3833439.1 hypothetical protein [Aeromonas veronii]